MYHPSVGRFLSEDPIGFDAGDANLYRYVDNSPTNFIDPSGEFKVELRYRQAGHFPPTFHADIVISDGEGTRAYWAGPDLNDFRVFDVRDDQEYGPSSLLYDRLARVQVVYDDGTDCPNPELENLIFRTLQTVDGEDYNFLFRNSNAAAFQTLRDTELIDGSFKPLDGLFVPGWARDPLTGQIDPSVQRSQ